MTISILAIDGQGKSTETYINLLLDTAEIFTHRKLILLTSDATAKHSIVNCIQVPKLDYLAYSRLCVEQLTEFVDTDFVLNVQLDGFIVNPNLWSEKFLDYDYIGAPWQSKKDRPIPNGIAVGNGGFSIRSKRLLDELSKLKWNANWENHQLPQKHWGNEDYFISILNRQKLEAVGISFSPVELASQFSVQSGDHLGRINILNNVFGFHGTGLLGKVKRHVEKQGIYYKHLEGVKKSIFPLRY